jgi:hypothetical protein
MKVYTFYIWCYLDKEPFEDLVHENGGKVYLWYDSSPGYLCFYSCNKELSMTIKC